MSDSAKNGRAALSWGEVLWDFFPTGKKLGGCAANVAFHLARLGVGVRLVTRVGRDVLGTEAMVHLAAAGVNTDLVQQDPHRPTGTVTVEVVAGEPHFAIATEAAWDRIEWTDAVAGAAATADLLYYGTLAQRTALGSGALRQAWNATKNDCVRVCDVNLRVPLPQANVVEASLRAADVVKLNERELRDVGKMFGVADPVRWLLDRIGVRLVALTRGARGCVLYRLDATVEHAGFPQPDRTGDRTGAGDAFTAALCASLVHGTGLGDPTELVQLAERANRIGSYVASCFGATPELPESLL